MNDGERRLVKLHKVGPKSLYSAERIALGITPTNVPYVVEVRGDPPQAIVVMLNGNIAQRYEYHLIDLVEAAVAYHELLGAVGDCQPCRAVPPEGREQYHRLGHPVAAPAT